MKRTIRNAYLISISLLFLIVHIGCTVPLIQVTTVEMEKEESPVELVRIVSDTGAIIYETICITQEQYNQTVNSARLDIENSNRWHGTSWILVTGGSP